MCCPCDGFLAPDNITSKLHIRLTGFNVNQRFEIIEGRISFSSSIIIRIVGGGSSVDNDDSDSLHNFLICFSSARLLSFFSAFLHSL